MTRTVTEVNPENVATLMRFHASVAAVVVLRVTPTPESVPDARSLMLA